MTAHENDKAPEAIRSVTLMVCTYRRREQLPRLLESVAFLDVPDGVALHVAVADNNPQSEYDSYIGSALERLPFDHSYGHEPAAGYSNARNKALELALRTPADILAFVDDDFTLDPGWLIGHLRSHHEFACDVIGGAIRRGIDKHEHGRPYDHGQLCQTHGAGNISFRRRLVDETGMGLRFDPRFNKTGREDQTFFSQAREKGANIVFSTWPAVNDPAMAEGGNWLQELRNKAYVSGAMQQNDIVAIRKQRGFLQALPAALWSVRFGAKALIGEADYALSAILGRKDRAALKRIAATKNALKMFGAFKGLSGDYVARNEVRRN